MEVEPEPATDDSGFKFPKPTKGKIPEVSSINNNQPNSQASISQINKTKPVTPITIPNEETSMEIKRIQQRENIQINYAKRPQKNY